MLALSGSQRRKNQPQIKVSLRKPFGIGFHRCSNGEGGAVVVQVRMHCAVRFLCSKQCPTQVKSEDAKTKGVTPGLRLVELNGRELGFDELSQALKRIPTGVDALMAFEEVRRAPVSDGGVTVSAVECCCDCLLCSNIDTVPCLSSSLSFFLSLFPPSPGVCCRQSNQGSSAFSC